MSGKWALGGLFFLVCCLPGCSNPEADFLPIHFESGTTQIVPEDRIILEADFQELADFPEVKVDLVGHTSSIGSDSANFILSYERADTIYQWLIDNGISSSRLAREGRGESEPVADNSTPEGRALNDRVEFVIR